MKCKQNIYIIIYIHNLTSSFHIYISRHSLFSDFSHKGCFLYLLFGQLLTASKCFASLYTVEIPFALFSQS